MKFLNYIPAVLSLCLIIGITIGYQFSIDIYYIFGLTLLNLIALFLVYFYAAKNINSGFFFSILTLSIFILIGMLSIKIQNDFKNEKYYGNFTNNKENEIYFKITKRLKPTKYDNKYEAEIISLNKHHTIGKVLLNSKKDSLYKTPKIGAIYYTKTELRPINKPKNPFEFDYNAYLKNKQIKYQIKTKRNLLFLVKNPYGIKKYTNAIIDKINTNLKKHHIKQNELAIINALLLAQRQDISKKLIRSYQNAGAMHILAVSGLHIGVIFGILLFLFSPFVKIFGKNKGKIIQYTLAVLVIWLYALLAGYTASIIRSVTMFTALAIGVLVNRKSATINNLFLSAFILLLIHPQYLVDVGFQLSYLAVFSIIFWTPIFKNVWLPKNKIIRLFWLVFTVSISAQIGVLPVSLYYFHQFPVLFFISGIVILPLLGFVIGFGFFVLILAYFNVLTDTIADFYFKIIEGLNFFIHSIANQEQFLVTKIFFPIAFVFLSYFIIIALYRLFQKFKFNRLAFLLVSILLFQSGLIYFKFFRESEKNWLVFNQNKHTILGFREGNLLRIETDLDTILKNHIIYTYLYGSGVANVKVEKIQNYFRFKQHKILVIDSFGVYKVKQIKPDIILLRKSPKINIERMIKQLHPKLIISDASNYKSYTNYYQQKAAKLKTPFYNTYKNGAFILKR